MAADEHERIINVTRQLVAVEQDVAARELDLAQREAEVVRRRHELGIRREELKNLRAQLSSEIHAAQTKPVGSPAQPANQIVVFASQGQLPPLARTVGTTVQRILGLLEMEARTWTAGEVVDRLGLAAGAVDSIRTALWKMHARGLIARPTVGKYCSRMYENEAVG